MEDIDGSIKSSPENLIANNANSEHSSIKPVRICGIARPIASMGDLYPASHWQEVHDIVAMAADAANFSLRLVSEGGGAGIIVSEIIDHLYRDPLVIVDVSQRNPNVMFELGMRVTFEKPVIIIKDDATPFSFDITPIRHIEYRRDLRHSKMMEFREELSSAIVATMESCETDKYRHYLKQFGPIEVTKIDAQQLSVEDIAGQIQELRREVSSLTGVISNATNKASLQALISLGSESLPNNVYIGNDHIASVAIDADPRLATTLVEFLRNQGRFKEVYLDSHTSKNSRIVVRMIGGKTINRDEVDKLLKLAKAVDPTVALTAQ